MKDLNIFVEKPKYIRHHKRKKQEQKKFKNHLNRDFKQDKPNMVWVSDITHIRVASKFIFSCSVIDLFSRKVVAFGLTDKIDSMLTLITFDHAYAEKGRPKNLMFHSDQGIQYTSYLFRKYLKENNVKQSYSHHVTPYDNAACEFFCEFEEGTYLS